MTVPTIRTELCLLGLDPEKRGKDRDSDIVYHDPLSMTCMFAERAGGACDTISRLGVQYRLPYEQARDLLIDCIQDWRNGERFQ